MLTAERISDPRGQRIALPFALLFLAVQAIYILHTRRHDYFFQDDFENFIIARTSSFGFHYLGIDVGGQFAPGFRLLNYGYTYIFGLNYLGVHLFDVMTIGVTTALLLSLAQEWRLRIGILAPAIVFIPFSPIFVDPLQWLASAVHVFDSMVFGTAALRWLGRPAALTARQRVIGAILFAIGLLFYAKTLFLSVLLLAVRVYVGLQEGAQYSTALWRAVKELALLFPIVLIYLSVVLLGHYHNGQPPPTIAPVAVFIKIGFIYGFACNLFGLAGTPIWWLACGLVLSPAAISITRVPRSWPIWAGFFLQFILGMALIGYGRVMSFGLFLAAMARYHTEITAFYLACIVICFGDVYRPAAARTRPVMADWGGVVVALVIAVYLGHASKSTALLYPQGNRVAVYVSNFQASLKAAGDTPIYNNALPDWVMSAFLVPFNQVRDFALLFPPGPNFAADPSGALVIGPDGYAYPAK